jgi:ABC-2 type transport system permease protein
VITALYLGALLRLPRWLIELSPVGQTTVPSQFPAMALVVMLVTATVLAAIAGLIYRNRDAV